MTLLYQGGVVIGWIPANPTQRVEVLRAPDSSGSPDTANEITLAILDGSQGGFVDLSAGVSLTFYHYRVRHVFPGYNPGTATSYIKAHGVEFEPNQVVLPFYGTAFSGGAAAGGDVQAGAFGVYTIRGPVGIGPDASGLATATLSVAHNRPSANTRDVWVATGGEGKSGGSSYFGVGYYAGQRLDLTGQADAGSFVQVHAGAQDDTTVILDDSVGTGTLANYYGVRFTQPQRNAGISVTNLCGIRIGAISRTWITNSYGIYVDSVSGAATANYAIYGNAGRYVFNAGAADNSEVWIGTTSDDEDNRLAVHREVGANTGETVRASIHKIIATAGATDVRVALEARAFSTASSGTVAQLWAAEAYGEITGAAAVTNFRGFTSAVLLNNASVTVTNWYGFMAHNPIITNGTLTNAYGVYVNDISTAGTLNYAIYTNSGDVRFGDRVILNATVRLRNYTVATLPAGTQGDCAFVTDALAPTFLAALVGGGAVVTPAFFDGTNWVAF